MVYGKLPHNTTNIPCILLKIFSGIFKSCIIKQKKSEQFVVCPKDLARLSQARGLLTVMILCK